MSQMTYDRPARRRWADRLGLRLYLGDRLRLRLARDRHDAPAVDVQGAVLDQDLGWVEQSMAERSPGA